LQLAICDFKKVWSMGLSLAFAALVVFTACRGAGNPPAATTAIEINAVPWGTVKSVASSDGRFTLAVNSQTPLRVKVPPGGYDVVIFGSKGQEQTPSVAATDDLPGKCTPVFEAVDAKQIIGTSPGPPLGEGDSSALANGIAAYYQGNFEIAETSLQQYLKGNVQRTGLAEFYLGASEMTRYYLAGGEGGTQSLRTAAQQAFRQAKQEPNFVPPDWYVSPKIIAAFENAPR
jgi:hypothetical protein